MTKIIFFRTGYQDDKKISFSEKKIGGLVAL